MKALLCGLVTGGVFGLVALVLPAPIGGLVTGMGSLVALAVVNAVQHAADVERRKRYVSQFERHTR